MKAINYLLIFLFILTYGPFLFIGMLVYGVWAGLRGGWRITEEWIDNWPEG